MIIKIIESQKITDQISKKKQKAIPAADSVFTRAVLTSSSAVVSEYTLEKKII